MRFVVLTLVLSFCAAAAERQGFAELPGGVRLFYRDHGPLNGVPVILLHAASGSSLAWEYQVPPLVNAGFRAIAYDRRGYGRTTVAPSSEGTAIDDLIGLADHLRLDKFHLLGTAAGAFVVFDAAISFPGRLPGTVAANTLGGVEEDAELAVMAKRLRPPQFNTLPVEFRELGPAYRAANAGGMQRWLELEKLSRAEGPPVPLLRRNKVTPALLETIRTPTLLVTGGADLYSPPPMQLRFAPHIKDAKVRVIPEAGHSAYWERPEEFNALVLDFLRKN